MKLLSLTLIFLLVFSCSEDSDNQVYSLPHWKIQETDSLQQLVVAVSNNEKGHLRSELSPIPNEILKPGLPNAIEFGGPELLSSYVKILRKRYGDRLVLLDTGRFIKSASNKEDKNSIVKVYKHLKYDAVLFTEEEVIQFLDENSLLTKNDLPFINSNIIDLRSKKLLTKNVIMDAKILDKDGLKVGIIGVTSYEGRKVLNHDAFKGIYFEKPAVTFLEFKNKLKRKGAEIIVLMANLKTSCKSEMPTKTLNSPRPTWAKIYCEDKKDDLLRFLKRIPRGSLDLLVLSNSDRQLRGYLLDTPVIATPPSAGYLRIVEVFYDKKQKKLVWEKSLLHPKLKLCQNFFRVTSDCHLEARLPGYKDRLEKLRKSALQIKPAMFLGHEVKPDISVKSILPILR